MAVDGSKVRQFREAAGLSQDALAASAGISRATMNKIESGNHQPMRLVAQAVATALALTVADISTDATEEAS